MNHSRWQVAAVAAGGFQLAAKDVSWRPFRKSPRRPARRRVRATSGPCRESSSMPSASSCATPSNPSSYCCVPCKMLCCCVDPPPLTLCLRSANAVLNCHRDKGQSVARYRVRWRSAELFPRAPAANPDNWGELYARTKKPLMAIRANGIDGATHEGEIVSARSLNA